MLQSMATKVSESLDKISNTCSKSEIIEEENPPIGIMPEDATTTNKEVKTTVAATTTEATLTEVTTTNKATTTSEATTTKATTTPAAARTAEASTTTEVVSIQNIYYGKVAIQKYKMNLFQILHFS